MARISILALGSRGDVQPYIALGKALQDAGHRVKVASFENFRNMADVQGLDFQPVRGDAQALVTGMAGTSMMEAGQNPIKMLRGIRQTFATIADDYIAAFTIDAFQDSEMIINQLPAALFGDSLAEALKIPHLRASVIPLIKTGDYPLSLLSTGNFGTFFNRLTYDFGEASAQLMFRDTTQRHRRSLGLGAKSRKKAPDPIINGFSRHVIPPSADWPPQVHQTGYWLLDEGHWQAPEALQNFLDAADAPIFIGFGSMPMRDPQKTLNIVLEALAMTGQRGIISKGWGDLAAEQIPENVFVVDYVPYTWLFPRMAAIVHHGGSGTTGMALRAGVPSLIVAFVADQPFWGKRIADLGVAPKHLLHSKLTAPDLSRAFTEMLTNQAMQRNAAELGAKLQAENGLAEAVKAIEIYLR